VEARNRIGSRSDGAAAGRSDSEAEGAEVLPRLVGAVPGVVGVDSHLTWHEPDLDE